MERQTMQQQLEYWQRLLPAGSVCLLHNSLVDM